MNNFNIINNAISKCNEVESELAKIDKNIAPEEVNNMLIECGKVKYFMLESLKYKLFDMQLAHFNGNDLHLDTRWIPVGALKGFYEWLTDLLMEHKEEIYSDDCVDRSGIEECKRRTEDLLEECKFPRE